MEPWVEGLHAMALDEAVLDDLLAAARAQSSVVAGLPPAEGRRHVALLLAAAEQRLARDFGRSPERALRRLLRGGAATIDDLGVRPDVAYHCVVADDGPPLGCPVETTIDGHRVGLAPDEARTRSARVPSAVTDQAASPLPGSSATSTRTIVVAPPGTPTEAAERYPACLAALHVAPGPGVHDLLDLAPALAFAGQPLIGSLLASSLLNGLNPHNEFHRELAATALAFLDHGQRLDQTAAALFVHPNTVRYRLRRLHAIVGPFDRLAMPEAVRLWWALRHWLA
ncbi:helix-turn-helix domain-containing protein [Actinoplanes sp. NPDC049265]|uniref:helix-turn-helix domain-containing protein n=1 Tax=Actinoplanes sp. NPDC049265 TaxID=3363902 RepID=UPI003719FC47